MRNRPARDDLFALFPDLPWVHPVRLVAKQIERVQTLAQRQVKQTQIRGENIRRQRAAAGRVRLRFSPGRLEVRRRR